MRLCPPMAFYRRNALRAALPGPRNTGPDSGLDWKGRAASVRKT